MPKRLILTLWLILAANPVSAQRSEWQIVPYVCDGNVFILNVAHLRARETDLIIVIARLGDGETRRDLNRRRLHNVRTYLTSESYRKRDPKTVVVAEGERVKGYGRIEIYLKGVLFDYLAVKRNGDLLVGTCESDTIRPELADEIFYPFLDAKSRKSKRKGAR
jgi:hypothetical protein